MPDNCNADIIAQINSVDVGKEVSIWPNPSTQYLYVDALVGQQVRLFNIEGKVMYNGIINRAAQEITLSHLPSGLYTLAVYGAGSYSQHKVLVVR